MLAFYTIIFGLALWFGLYLVNRDWRSMPLRFAGLGLASYGLALALRVVANLASQGATSIEPLAAFAPFLPVVCWLAAIVALLPNEARRSWPARTLLFLIIPVTAALALWGSFASVQLQSIAGVVGLGGILAALAMLWRHVRVVRPANIFGLLLAATLFFTLGVALLVLPLQLLPQPWMLLAIGADLGLLGLAVVRLDAFQQGEKLALDMLRSFDSALITAALTGGQIGLVVAFVSGPTLPVVMLLFSIIATAIGLAVFANPVQQAIDTLVLSRFPAVRQARADLRTAAEVLPRIAPSFDLAEVDEEEFARMTRRALSNFGNLPRLATSPLARLPQIDARLAARHAPDDTIERAAELKALLTERIERLKPREGSFGTTDEWRYYNALYFPYVLGLKPYSRRLTANDTPATVRTALEWFQRDVPERTLYNWQNTAARLLAHNLREEAVKR